MTAEIAPPNKFDASHLKRGLGRRSAIGSIIILGTQGAKFILNLVSIAALARLLSPSDFGLIAMVLPIFRFAANFQDMGLTSATIHRENIDEGQVNALFWFNALASLILAGVITALAPVVAAFYGRPELEWITIAFGVILLFSGLSAQHMALIQRQMRVMALSIMEATTLAFGIAAGVAAAMSGLGYWSLVIIPATTAVTSTIWLWALSGWRPGLPRWHEGVGQMLTFGSNITLASFCQWANRNLDNVIIGNFWGDEALGLYSRAYSVLLLPLSQVNSPMNRVVLPALSRLQNDPERYRNFYFSACGMTASLTMPLVCFLAVSAQPALLIVLGEGWDESVIIFQALAPAAFIGTTNAATGWAYTSLGNTGRQLRWALIQSPVIIAAFFVGLPWGPVGVAAGYSSAVIMLRIPSLLYCFHGTPLRLKSFLLALAPAAVSSIGAAIMLVTAQAIIGPVGDAWQQLLMAIPVYAGAYLMLYPIFPQGRAYLQSIAAKLT